MNWTGGSRARSGKPSSDTARLQKSYFAKVRAKNSTPFAHAALSFTCSNDDSLSASGHWRKSRVPELDIIQGQELQQRKRKSQDTSKGIIPFEGLSNGVDKMGEGRSSDIKTKKQRLLEKDSWVCTALARPLVLKSKQMASTVCPQIRPTPEVLRNPEIFLDPVNQDEAWGAYEEPLEDPDYFQYSLPERRPVSNEGRGLNAREFRNLSDGGYVQIGGESTQFGGSIAEQQQLPTGGDTSQRSDEIMLFDLEGRQEESSPPGFLRRSGIFARNGGANNSRRALDDPMYNLDGWDANRYVSRDGFPSSPLAAYSQISQNRGLFTPTRRPATTGKGNGKDIIEEIDEVATEPWASSPSEVLPVKHAQPQVTPLNLTHEARNIHAQGPIGRQTREKLFDIEKFKDRYNNVLSRLLQERGEDVQQTPNQSLVACASSVASTDEDEGEEWMLGSNIPQRSSQGNKATDLVSAEEAEDGWKLFIKENTVSEEEESMDDYQKPNKLYPQEGSQDSDELEEDQERESLSSLESGIPEDVEQESTKDTFDHIINKPDETIESQETQSQDFIRSLNLEYIEPSVLPLSPRQGETGLLSDKEENWREFVKTPQAEPVISVDRDQGETQQEKIEERIVEKPEPAETTLEFDKDEDAAWRAFVFAGLSDELEPDPEPLKPPEATRRRATLPLKSLLKPPKSVLPASPKENLYTPSMAGATVGSGSELGSIDTTASEATSSEAGSSPVVRRSSKFFSDGFNLTSSPPASPAVPVGMKDRSLLPIGWRGRGNLRQRGRRERKKNVSKDDMDEKAEEEEIEDIED